MQYIDILHKLKQDAPISASQILARKKARFSYLQDRYKLYKDTSVLPEARELKQEIQALQE